MRKTATAALALALLLVPASGRTEVLEEIVAKVNDDVITKSELETAEEQLLAEAYRRYTGAELDAQVQQARSALLRRMVDRKVLFHRGARMFELDKLAGSLVKWFREQQNIENDQELERLISQENMTMDELRTMLLEMNVPDEVMRYEVYDRVSVGDKDALAYYETHPAEFDVPASVVLREIVLLADTDARRAERRTEAQAIRERAAAEDADFAAIAESLSEAGTASEGGRIGPLLESDLSPVLREAAMTLPPGEVSPVLEAPYGLHIIRVEERQERRHLAFDAVKEDIRKTLEQQRIAEVTDEFLHKAWCESTIEISEKYENRLVDRRDRDCGPELARN